MSVPRFPDRAEAITPSDAAFLSPTTVYVGVTGDVTVEPWVGDNTVTFVAVPAGTAVPVRAKRVLATGTTATDLVGVR
jgi:hypothetical protein